jgi:hypothetical protein
MQVIFDDEMRYDRSAGIVCFLGRDDAVLISFGCTREALMNAGHLMAASEADLMVVFTRHRDRIRAIAREKYAAGAIERPGVCIVKTVDMNR